MSTSYPGAIDTLTNPDGTDGLDNPSHADQHTNANDAIEAIQTTLGVKYGARVKAIRSTNQSLNNSSSTTIDFTAADEFDTDGFHDPSSNSTRITIPSGLDGVYLVLGHIQYAQNSTGVRINRILVNGSATNYRTTAAAFSTSTTAFVQVYAILELAATNYVEMDGFQTSGGALNVSTASLALFKIA